MQEKNVKETNPVEKNSTVLFAKRKIWKEVVANISNMCVKLVT